jgi:hypothetical protein
MQMKEGFEGGFAWPGSAVRYEKHVLGVLRGGELGLRLNILCRVAQNKQGL